MAGKQKSSRGSVKSRVRKCVRRVRTESTYPPKGLFTKSALTIARSLASKRVSPKGPRSGMRMLTYFINRAGHGLNTRGVERNSKGPRPCFQSESERREQGRASNSRRDNLSCFSRSAEILSAYGHPGTLQSCTHFAATCGEPSLVQLMIAMVSARRLYGGGEKPLDF